MSSRRARLDIFRLLRDFLGGALMGTVAGVLVGGLFLGVCALVAENVPVLGLPIYGLLLLFATGFFLIAYFLPMRRLIGIADPDVFLVLANMGILAGVLAMLVVGSGEFLRYWSLSFGDFAPARETGYWSWALYGVSWVADNGLANIGQIWGWNVSDIHPTTDTGRYLVSGYNVILEVVALGVLGRVGALFATAAATYRRTA
jgi:hypothetical protein